MQRLVIAIAFVALAGAVCARAQMLRAEIPFDFTVGKTTLPAGVYTVDKAAPSLIVFRGVEGSRKSCLHLGYSAYRPFGEVKPKIVFTRIGESYFLHEVWNGTQTGLEFGKTSAEKEMLARGDTAEKVVLALRGKK